MKDWLVDTLGLDPDFARGLQIIIALIVILALIGIFTWVLARIKGMRTETGRRSRQPRLAVMDSTPIDNHRRLVLVRRDSVEHLILVGGDTDIVVEQAIVRGAPVSAQPQRQSFPAAAPHAPVPKGPASRQPQTQPASPPNYGHQRQRHPGPQTHAPQAAPPQARPAPSAAHSSRPEPPAPANLDARQSPAPKSPTLPAAREPVLPSQPLRAAKSGFMGAAASVFNLGKSKPQPGANDAPVSAPRGDRPQAREDMGQFPGASQPHAPAAAQPVTQPPVQPRDQPELQPDESEPPVRIPEPRDAKTSPPDADVDLEQAIGLAVAQETDERGHSGPAGERSPSGDRKMSPKDELAHQLEELLSAPNPGAPRKPEPEPAAPFTVAPTAGPEDGTAEGQAGDDGKKTDIAAPIHETRPVREPRLSEVVAATESRLAASRPGELSPASAGPGQTARPKGGDGGPGGDPVRLVIDRDQDNPPPPTGAPERAGPERDRPERTVPAELSARKFEPGIEPRMEAPGPSQDGPDETRAEGEALRDAPDVLSPAAAPRPAQQAAPEPKIEVGPRPSDPTDSRDPDQRAKDDKADSIASIEEEMAKLLSELSGPRKN